LNAFDPRLFRSHVPGNRQPIDEATTAVARDVMTIEHVIRLISDVANVTDVVGLGITEHLPWEATAMKEMLSRLPLFRRGANANAEVDDDDYAFVP
jgi:arginase